MEETDPSPAFDSSEWSELEWGKPRGLWESRGGDWPDLGVGEGLLEEGVVT